MPTKIQLNPILAKLPLIFFKWWYYEAPPKLFTYLVRVFAGVAHLLSIELLVKTFFEPWRAEYRKGFVAVATFVGISVRVIFLIFDIFALSSLFLWSIFIFLSWFILPITPLGALLAFFRGF